MKIRITVIEKTTYTDVVEMPAKEFRSLQKRLDDATGFRTEIKEEIAAKITRSDKTWLDGDVQDVEIEKESP